MADISKRKQKGEELIAKKLFKEAREIYEELRESAKGDPTILVKLGDISAELGEKEKAIEDYNLAAFAFTRLGSITNAIASAKVILKLDPTKIELLDEISSLYLELNQAESAPSTEPVKEDRGAEDETSFPKTPLFSSLPRIELIEVINAANHVKVSKGKDILSTDDESRSIFVITSGSAEVTCKTPNDGEVTCATLDAGDFFGEIGYFSGEHRTANVKATEDIELLELTRTDMRLLVDSHHSMGDVLFDFYKERVLDQLLAVSNIFMHLTLEDRKAVLELVDSEVFADGMDIVTEGETGEDMFLIKTGSVEVWTKDKNGRKKILAELKEGDSFGQLALVLETTRGATVTALTPVELITFSKNVLQDILSKYPAIQKSFDEEAMQQVAGIERLREKLPASLT
jgi:CRP-like cAMP-binding protein